MNSWATLIVAGRIDGSLHKEKLSSLLSNCLITCYGTEAPQVDSDYAQFAAAFAKPTLSKEFGLTNAHSGNSSSHLVRVQYNPTSDQFRSALREALRHALIGARPAETQASTEGRVSVVYVGQVLGHTGEWLLADSSLSAQAITSWLDCDAARSWWPQLDKFVKQDDHLHLQLFTPLAGTGTNWSATKPNHPHRLLTNVDVYLVHVDLVVEGSWRLNGRPVVMDTLGTAYDGLRTFAQLAIEHHPISQFSLPSDGSPLGCALAAERPALYMFPGGGLSSQASGLFSLQGFTMLLNGSFTGQGAPGWWSMVRNLPKLDAVVLPDWSAANVLTHQFVSESRRLDSAESRVLGDLLAPPPCALAPGEVTGGLVVHAPSSADQPHCFHWAPTTADTLPPAITLYFKLGWGELKLQPLAQRAGLLLIWTSAVPGASGQVPSSLRILYPAAQFPGATTPVQGLSRLLKALGSIEHCQNGGGGVDPCPAKTGTHKPLATRHSILPTSTKPTESSNRSLVQPTRSAAVNHAPKPSTESQSLKKPSVPKRPATATNRPTTATAKPQSSYEPKPQSAKPQTTSRPLPSRPATASKASSRPSTTKSSQPARNETAAATTTTTASKLAAHANLVASKQTGGKPKAPLANHSANTTSRPVAKPPARATSEKVSKPDHISPPALPATGQQRDPPAPAAAAVNESLELAPMDPLITGWRESNQSPVGEAAVLPPTAMAGEEPPREPDFSEMYKVHKFEHLNEADEMALDDHRDPLSDTHPDDTLVQPSNPDDHVGGKQMDDHAGLAESTTTTTTALDPDCLPDQLTNSTVSDVLKLIDPKQSPTGLGSPMLPEPEPFYAGDETQLPPIYVTGNRLQLDEDIEQSDAIDQMSRPPQFIEATMDQEAPVMSEDSELRTSQLADLKEGVSDVCDDPAFAVSTAAAAAAFESGHTVPSREPLTHTDFESHDQSDLVHAADHQASGDGLHRLFDKHPLNAESYPPSSPTPAVTDTFADIPADLVPDPTDLVEPMGSHATPVEESVDEPHHSCQLRSRPPLDIGLEDEGIPEAISRTSMVGEESHCSKFNASLEQGQTSTSDCDEREPVESAAPGSPTEAATPAERFSVRPDELTVASGEDQLEVSSPASKPTSQSAQEDLHVDVEEKTQSTEHDAQVHPTVPFGFRAQHGSPGSDTSDLELNDREFWVSSTRVQQTLVQPLEPDLGSPDSAADVVLDSQDLMAMPTTDTHPAGEDWSSDAPLPPGNTHEESSEVDRHTNPDVELGAVDANVVDAMDVVRLSADSLETTQEDQPVQQPWDPCVAAHESQALTDVVPMGHQSRLPADSTTADADGDQELVDESRPIGFVGFTPDQTTDPVNFGSPVSDASVDSVIRTTGPPELISSSNQIEPDTDQAVDGNHWPIGFKRFDSSNLQASSENGLQLGDEVAANGVHTENGNHVTESSPNLVKKAMSFTPSESGPPLSEVHFAGDCATYPSPLFEKDLDQQPPMSSCPHATASGDSTANETAFDPLSAWGQPQGMPAPTSLAKPGSMHKAPASSSNSRSGGTTQRPSSALKSTTGATTKSAPTGTTSPPVLPPGPPIYLDLIWVPSYLAYVPQNLAVEFFTRVRARVYVISGEALHPTVGEALLAGKAKWNPNDVDLLCRSPDAQLSILPTDEPYEWACWLRTPCGREDRETGESRLQASGFRVMPTVSLCDIEYSANNVAFRCEGVRVDL